MSNIPYYNRAGPFWDFIASFDNRGPEPHPYAYMKRQGIPQNVPFFTQEQENPTSYTNDQADGQADGRATQSNMQPDHNDPGSSAQANHEQEKEKPGESSNFHHDHGHGRGGRFGHGRGRGGPWQSGSCGRGAYAGARGGYGGMHGNPRCGRSRGNPGFADLANDFANKMFGPGGPWAGKGPSDYANNNNEDFSPPVDVFDTESAFIVHVSLAGAQKEDVAVNWAAEKSEVHITGVLHRPGDEELLQALAMSERAAGAFERRVRLGSPSSPARVEVDGITAKLEDGVLKIEIPKEDKDFVEVKKVDIE